MSDSDVVDLKVMVGRIEERLKLVERVIYGMAGLVLVAFVVALTRLVFTQG